ncbi:MAG: response regulator [Burkholderiales bacterium]|nr:response regulator [Burkholderiales bacterium]
MAALAWKDLEHFAWLDTAIWVCDGRSGEVCWANQAALALWQVDACSGIPMPRADVPAMLARAQDDETVISTLSAGDEGRNMAVQIKARAMMLGDGRDGLCVEGRPVEFHADPASLRGVEAVLHFSLIVIMFDLQGRVVMRNPSAQRVFPQLADEGGNAFFGLLVDEMDAEGMWQAALEYGADQGEQMFKTSPRPRWYAYSLHRVVDPVTGAPALLLSGQDISERVLSEQKFKVLFEQSANAMLLIDPITGRVKDCNRAAAQALRLASRRQVVEADPAQFFPELQRDGRHSSEKIAQIYDRTLKRGWQRFEWMFMRSDGGELLVEVTLSPVHLGDQPLLMAVWYDLSFRRMIERGMLEAKEAAEHANHAKSLFLANMSHEIRTPLNAIVGMTSLLLDTPLTEKQREWLDIVRFSSEGLVDLVGDILDFSRIEAGKLTLDKGVFDLRALIARSVELLRVRAEEKSLRLALIVDSAVPRWVEGDEGRLRQVLINLLGNAVKFTDQGGVTLTAYGSTMDDGRVAVALSITDTGIGIEAAKLDSIFDAFAQADGSISRRYGGSGLGLTISRRLIMAMGGDISVQSKAGQGSTFNVHLPLMPAAAPLPSAAPEAPVAAEGGVLRVLLVEDNPMNEKLALALLGEAGHDVVVARNGVQGVDRYGESEFDLVLMDMQMPEMDGLTATRTIRAMEMALGRGRTPIVAMTANVMPEDRQHCFDAGMDDFLGKPISVARLNEIVRTVGGHVGHLPSPGPTMPESVPAAFDLVGALAACGGNRQLLDELAALFCTEWPERRARLLDAASQGDAAALARHAHMLKGSFGALSATAPAEAALRVDQSAKAGMIDAALLSQLIGAGDDLVVILDALISPAESA